MSGGWGAWDGKAARLCDGVDGGGHVLGGQGAKDEDEGHKVGASTLRRQQGSRSLEIIGDGFEAAQDEGRPAKATGELAERPNTPALTTWEVLAEMGASSVDEVQEKGWGRHPRGETSRPCDPASAADLKWWRTALAPKVESPWNRG